MQNLSISFQTCSRYKLSHKTSDNNFTLYLYWNSSFIRSDPQLNFSAPAFFKYTTNMFQLGFYEIRVVCIVFQLDGFSFNNGKFTDDTFFAVCYRTLNG